MSATNSARNRKSASKVALANADQPASETAVINAKEKRGLAEKMLKRMKAGDELPPDEELWLMAWGLNATPATKARLNKLCDSRHPAKQPEPPKKPPCETDIEAIGHKLGDIGYMLIALHDVARSSDIDSDVLEVMAIEFAKRGVHIIDACHERLGQFPIGRWDEEIEEAAEEVE